MEKTWSLPSYLIAKTSTLFCRGAHLRGLPWVDRGHWLHDTLHDHVYNSSVECWKSYILLHTNMLFDDNFITFTSFIQDMLFACNDWGKHIFHTCLVDQSNWVVLKQNWSSLTKVSLSPFSVISHWEARGLTLDIWLLQMLRPNV